MMKQATVAALALTITGCPPGEEVAKLAVASGGKAETSVTVSKGQELHFWEDYRYRHDGGAGWVSESRKCFRWNIRLTQDGQKARALTCWSLEGSRCDKKLGNHRKINCEVPDCTATIGKSGTVNVEASLEKAGECNVTVSDMALRIRRVDD